MYKRKTQSTAAALQALILPTLMVVFGLQALRGFIPGLAWYLRDTVGAGTLSLLPYAFGTFFLGFLAILVARLFKAKLSLWISAGGLTALRLVEQVVKDPAWDFWLGIAGVGLFLIYLPLFISWTRNEAEPFPGRWYKGLVLGFAVDTSIRGLFGMRELSTVDGWIPILITSILGVLVIWSLGRERFTGSGEFSEGRGKSIILLLSLGPYFVLQLLFLQNTGWLEEVSGLCFPLGFLIISLGYVASIWGFDLGYSRPRCLHPSLMVGSGLLLVYGVYYADQLEIGTLALILIGQFILGCGLGGIGKANQETSHKSAWRTTLAVNGGMVLFLILSFAYYVAQDIALPISRASFPALAAGAFALLMIWASFLVWKESTTDPNPAGLLATSILVLIPIICWCLWGTGPAGEDPPGFPIRVMSYNIHSAYNVAGGQDLEAIASVIEDSEADIIGLQEISRTRLMDGGADMPTWLAGRLDMEMVFAGTEEPIWGNAILSRYPILDSGYQALPREDSLIGRGVLWARIDVGEEKPLLVVVTHLHHLAEDSHVRLAQVPLILDFLENESQFILLGDFNATPDSPEMGLIYEAGLMDAWLEAGEGLGYTVGSNNLGKRIDYLWNSSDLTVDEIEVIQTTASDHMPVVGVLEANQ
jgi:endonuclease/exonuclease/phosphatase family metal-dependent hydrolase